MQPIANNLYLSEQKIFGSKFTCGHVSQKVLDIYGPDSDDSDSSSEDYSEGRHGDVSGDVLLEDGEPDASTSLAVRTKEQCDSRPKEETV